MASVFVASSTLSTGSSSSVIRRTANHHPNVWDDDFVQSLQSPYTDSCYGERAETLISEIKLMLSGEGDELMITPSAYDTAWVAMVPAIDGSSRPQFPQTVDWILKNQLKDGSWGTESHFLLSDRLLATLSCVLALHKWKVGDVQVEQGIEFIKSNLEAIKDESDQDNCVTDFEIIFPSLLREAQSLHLGLPYDMPYVHMLQMKRQERLANLSRDEIHGGTLLSSLEGIPDMVEWERIMNVQSQDGSFSGSPASTACVFIHTGDMKCLEFFNNVLAKFGSFVPFLYPVDLLEGLLMVDNIVRLGIDRHFEKEIKEILDCVYRHWNERLNPVADLEITALGFRLLRLHRYSVTPAIFDHFKDANGHFFGSTSQFNRDVASMLSLYRASQLAFPGETILHEARDFARKYLREALQKREIFTAWNNKQNLSHAIQYELDNSWHVSVPRVEAKRYCQVYSSDYVRLTKSLYKCCIFSNLRLPRVNNQKILELAKLDFNIVQAIHQKEMKNVTNWFKHSEFPLLPFGRERPVECFFLVAAGTYEPQYAKCRFLFSKVACLCAFLHDMYDTYGTLDELKLFTEAVRRWDLSLTESLPDYMKLCYKIFYDIVHEVVREAEKLQGRELLSFFRKGWEEYLLAYNEEAEWLAYEYVPSLEEYLKNGIISVGQRILLLSGVLLMEGQILSQETLEQLDYPGRRVLTELNCIITRLTDDIQTYKAEKARGELVSSIECYMKEHPGSTEEVAVNYMYNLLEPAVKELTWEFLKPHSFNIPFDCKKMAMEETRVTMVIFKEGDGFGISKIKIKDYIKECLIEPLPL